MLQPIGAHRYRRSLDSGDFSAKDFAVSAGEYNHFGMSSAFESDPQHNLMASLAISVTEHALQGTSHAHTHMHTIGYFTPFFVFVS